MPPHEQFQLMCALAAAHQLDAAEQQVFDDHLAECDLCRTELRSLLDVVGQLGRDEFIEPAALEEPGHSSRFLKFAADQGLTFSGSARRALGNEKSHRWHAPAFAYAAAAALVIVSIVPTAILLKTRASVRLPQSVLATEARPAVVVQPVSSNVDRERLTELERRLADAEARTKEVPPLEKQIEAGQTERDRLQTVVVKQDTEIGQLKQKMAESEARLATTQSSIAALMNRNEDLAAELVGQRARAASLSDEILDQKAAFERERQLTSATREIRELMGARRLYMIDVYDGEETARAKRSFGRVFYTEGQSLIFYAFDLDQKKRGSKRVTFAAWGQRGKDPGTIKQLGMFQVDDVAQKRWVLKVDDPEKLKSIEAIFVTVESNPGTERPTGQKLLYAYLGGQPNHP
jgi:peptidoglycan hydrolase CwlO-like protein